MPSRRRRCGRCCGCGVVVGNSFSAQQSQSGSSLSSSVATRRRRDVRRQRPKERKKERSASATRTKDKRERERASTNVGRKEGRRPKRSWGAARSAKLQAAESGSDRNSLSGLRQPTHPPIGGRDRSRCGTWLSLAASSVPVYFPVSQLSGEQRNRRAKSTSRAPTPSRETWG